MAEKEPLGRILEVWDQRLTWIVQELDSTERVASHLSGGISVLHRILRAGSLMLIFASPTPCWGQVTFLGPTPYLSSADSPFDLSGLGSTFFLEDFEDGDWDLPAGVTAAPFVVRGPSSITDSVDGDDGLIDGQGAAGHSLVPSAHLVNFTNPLTHMTFVDMTFRRDLLGFTPNAFGFVWTDGVPGSYLGLGLRDENFNVVGGQFFFADMGTAHNGETSRDRFVGFVTDVPFQYVYITNFYHRNLREDLFEIDHVQFGVLVPEPHSQFRVLLVLMILFPDGPAIAIWRNVVHRKEESDENAQVRLEMKARWGGQSGY